MAHATNTISNSNANQKVNTGVGGDLTNALNWFGNHVASGPGDVGRDIAHGAEVAGSDVMNTLNKPMQFVQHEYRYLHDVEATHGRMAALLEGLGVAAGAVVGGVATGSLYGAVLGGEGAAALEGQMFYKDSWARTGSASYTDPHTHQPVSLGRDIVSFLGNTLDDATLRRRASWSIACRRDCSTGSSISTLAVPRRSGW